MIVTGSDVLLMVKSSAVAEDLLQVCRMEGWVKAGGRPLFGYQLCVEAKKSVCYKMTLKMCLRS